MKRSLMKFACLTACMVAMSSYAQDKIVERAPVQRDAQKRQLIERYDLNKSGVLDPEEVEHIGRDRLLRWDSNKDGKVDQVELESMRKNSRKMAKQDKASLELERAKAQLQAQLHEESKKNGKLDNAREHQRDAITK